MITPPNILPFTRRVHAFCVGAPKSGTHSIATLFGEALRCAHEPHALQLIRIILAHEGVIGSDVQPSLKARDARLQLELEASHILIFFLEHLVACFPDARFILTVRPPKSWLESSINNQLGWTSSPDWQRFRAFRFSRPEYGHAPEAAILRNCNLHPLDGYLAYWAWHNETVLRLVPLDRLLVVPTREISAHAARMAAFLDVDPALVEGRDVHAFPAPKRFDILPHIDPDFLEDRIMFHCERTIEKLDRLITLRQLR